MAAVEGSGVQTALVLCCPKKNAVQCRLFAPLFCVLLLILLGLCGQWKTQLIVFYLIARHITNWPLCVLYGMCSLTSVRMDSNFQVETNMNIVRKPQDLSAISMGSLSLLCLVQEFVQRIVTYML